MAEEAYSKGSNSDEQHEAAGLRALICKDNDDQIAWLNKADTADPGIKGFLANALGTKAFEEGRDDEAVTQFRAAISAYAAMPRSARNCNETALAYYAIFAANGDRQALERCNDFFQQAVDLNPSDSILLYNAGTTLLSGAIADVIGSAIDLRALHEPGSIDLLGYLYLDQPSRDGVVQRLRSHPGITHALSYLQKVNVLAPRNTAAWAIVYHVDQFEHDEAALRALEPRIKASDLDASDQLTDLKEFLSGAKDQQRTANLTASLKRSQDLADRLRPGGGCTAAVAIDRQVQQMLVLDQYTGTADADRVVALGTEAQRIAPSANAGGVLMVARLFRAARTLRHADPAFDAFYQKHMRSIGITALMAVAASEPSSYQQKVLHDPDMLATLDLVRDDGKRFPMSRSPDEWALLKNADAPEAQKVAESIRSVPRKLVEQSIIALLEPADVNGAMEAYWLLQINGQADAARAALHRVADQGIPTAIQP
jgi:hypothetical protein